ADPRAALLPDGGGDPLRHGRAGRRVPRAAGAQPAGRARHHPGRPPEPQGDRHRDARRASRRDRAAGATRAGGGLRHEGVPRALRARRAGLGEGSAPPGGARPLMASAPGSLSEWSWRARRTSRGARAGSAAMRRRREERAAIWQRGCRRAPPDRSPQPTWLLGQPPRQRRARRATVALALLLPARAAALDVKLWPLLRYARDEATGDVRCTAFGPLIEFRRTAETRDFFIRPLLHLHQRRGAGHDDRSDILYPLATTRWQEDYQTFRLLLFTYRTGTRAAAAPAPEARPAAPEW